MYYWIIKPKEDWIDWSLPRLAIHGLKRSYIQDHGVPADQVFNEMMAYLADAPFIYSDAPQREELWLKNLGCSGKIVKDIKTLIPSRYFEKYNDVRTKVIEKYKLIKHRADHDALSIALTVNNFRVNSVE